TLNTVPSASTVEVDLVKQVVEIGANLNFAVLANQFHVWQTKRLAELRVDVEVSRSCERIACNSRNGRQASERLLPTWAGRGRRVWKQTSKERSRLHAWRRKERISGRTGVPVKVRMKTAEKCRWKDRAGTGVARWAASTRPEVKH